ncbi:fructosamine kinase family protein [Sunxiuqinia sp. A32]|uniref:fructosamine kinase family protein n=1 Tax=Sunxiuqinia sp. A32 TaxID=3461496 RepID=UPI004045D08A
MEKKVIQIVCDDYQNKFGDELIIQQKRPVGGGCISHSLKLLTNQGEYFLKWNRFVEPDLFIREAESLNEMASVTNAYLTVPKVVLSRDVDNHPGYILMNFLPSGHTSNEDENLGIGLALLHKKSADRFGFYNDNYCGSTLQLNGWTDSWIEFFGQKRILFLIQEIQKNRHLSEKELNTYHRLIDRLPNLIGEDHKPSLIHGDLWSGNYMYTTNGPAIIDPATYYADREMEFSIMTMFGGFSQTTWNAYQYTFPFEKGWEERVQLYQIYHVLNHYHLFGGSYGNQAFSIAKKFV